MPEAPTLFTDVETTGLDPRIHHIWELAVIRRESDGHETEHLWQIRPDLTGADPIGLEKNRFRERFAIPDGWDAASFTPDGNLLLKLTLPELLFDVQEVLNGDGGVMVGSNATFDDTFIKKLLWANGRTVKWHYRPVCVATLAAGFLYGQAQQATKRTADPSWYGKVRERLGWPWKSYQASEAAGVARPADDVAHTALGDARWARDLWDHITVPDAFYTATDHQLADMVADAMGRRGGGA